MSRRLPSSPARRRPDRTAMARPNSDRLTERPGPRVRPVDDAITCNTDPNLNQPEDTIMVSKTLDDLFLDTLKDIYYAERKILKALPKMARGATVGKTCAAIEGILEEGEDILEEYKGSPALDAGLISSAQAVEHYEMTRYGTLHRWAQDLGMSEAAKLLAETLAEEKSTDKALTGLADISANAKAKAKKAAA